MTISIKSLTKQTVIYGFGTILTRLVTFMLLPVYTNVLTKSDYGLAVLVFVFLGFMNHVYNYGLDSAQYDFQPFDFSVAGPDQRGGTFRSRQCNLHKICGIYSVF